MVEPHRIVAKYYLTTMAVTVALLVGCSGEDSQAGVGATGGAAGQGGQEEVGGESTSGGSSSPGGATGAGGSNATGGLSSTGGSSATGGMGGIGGAATGGSQIAGGTKATDGTTALGSTRATGGASATGGTTALGGTSGTSCPFTGHVTYTLSKSSNPTAEEQNAYALITAAMDKAVAYYNCYTNITKAVSASYVPSVGTADGNINGSMRFGSNTTYMDYRTAMHEISHTVGIGTASGWASCVDMTNKLYSCAAGKQQLADIDAQLGNATVSVLHADTQHFWPYGINQQSEVKSESDLIFHCQMVMAMRKDMGLN